MTAKQTIERCRDDTHNLAKQRQETLLAIIQLLRDRQQHTRPDKSLKDIVKIAKKLELSLYRMSRTLDEYKDPKTMSKRVLSLAVEHAMYQKLRLLTKAAGTTSKEQRRAIVAAKQGKAATGMPQTVISGQV